MKASIRQKLQEKDVIGLTNMTTEEMVTAATTSGAISGDVGHLLQVLMLKRLQAEETQKEEVARQDAAARKATAQLMESERKKREALQSVCPHLKEDGKTALVGQRGHDNKVILTCQKCQKLFIGEDVPRHLYPDSARIGGPDSLALA